MTFPPLHNFKVFESVARLGSLAAAAIELHVTTGAVSQQVKALQASLGIELFEKRGRQLVLTANGRLLQKHVANAMSEISNAVASMQTGSAAEQEVVEITLSIPPAEGVEWLTTPLLRFMEASRSVRVSVITAPGIPQVDWRRADIAVVYGSPPWPGLWWRLLHGIRMTPVCSPQFLRGPKAIREVPDLARHRLLHEDNGRQWQQWLADVGINRIGEEDIFFEDFGMVLQAARDGFGVALSDELVSARDLDEGRLVRPLSITVPALHNYYVTCSEAARERPEIRAFIDWLLATAGQPDQ
ncbi:MULTISPECIES: LysR substrate-binding domain-containing protein [Pseudomonas]|jgi:LysR family glycine cleavage system transcriptional activator|uniref:LysR substrate-binding domain-containing protein n=1 Tax=Pseudomonas sp. BF-R-19 TaxID=2832397 RepID=UPI001CBE251B|nr:LysR substrate-binding domain-containing protein [Pseudomonas sp. BF-R-19]